MKNYLLISLLTFSILSSNDSLDIGDDFLQSLDEVSEIATKTKLNIDDAPSFVTVLHSEKLKKLGVENVFEALGLVPGVQLKKELSGVPVVIFRGVSQKGEVKLMIDGVTINNSYRGSIYYYLDFPIEMVKRIEVIRGTGSVLYGSNAISGVVNIITNSSQKDSKNKVFISGGTYDYYKGGALVSTNIGDVKFALDTYYQKNDKTVSVGSNPSGMSGDSDRHLKDYSVGINISDEHFSLLGRVKKSEIGNAYGIFSKLDADKNKYDNANNSYFTQLSYKDSVSKNNKVTVLAGYNRYGQKVAAAHSALGDLNSDYIEESYFFDTNFISTSIKDNELLVGLKYESNNELQNDWEENGIEKPNRIVGSDFSREIKSIYLNDKYSASSNFDISAGLRYDNYSDFGDAYSPNIGLVYRLNKQIKLKALYSHAFRTPSWVELTSNSELEAEKANSIEAGIVFKQNQQNVLRVNFYATQINDMIAKDATRKYVQDSKNEFLGSELEYIFSPNNQTELNFLASYIDAKDEDGNTLVGVANILASTSLTYELSSGINFGSLLKYVSGSKRSTTDSRENMKDSLIFDQTISYTHKDFTASLVLKDLFDAGTYYALPKNSYEKDFDDEGRVIILKANLEF